jgi:hypothetical protein
MSTTRRGFLRGTFAGSAVAVGLPFLDCFLNESGTALAGTGQALPSVFGNWFQYLGLNPGRWVPDQTGSNYRNKVELAMFDPWKERINLISGGYYHLDGRPVETHKTGVQIATLGGIPSGRESVASLDSDIATRTTNPYNVSGRIRGLDVESYAAWFYNDGGDVWHPHVDGQRFPGAASSEDDFGWADSNGTNTSHLCHTTAGEIVWMVR